MRLLILSLLVAATAAAGPRKYILELRDMPASRAASRLAVDAPEVYVRHQYALAFRGVAVELGEGESVEELARLPYVTRVHPDPVVYALGEAVDAHRTTSRARTHASGNGVVVAVIDTGIDRTHPALAGKIIGGWDFADDDNDPMDTRGHGTHVAGIIAAESAEITGVATGVRLLAYKVFGPTGPADGSDIIAAIERAMDPNRDGNRSDRADVINLSLGGPGRFDGPIANAVENAVAAGIVVCIAAGNAEGKSPYHNLGSPAAALSAITVGAIGIEGGKAVVTGFSCRGPAAGSTAIKPEVVAPGNDILSTVPGGYEVMSGTSMAAPYVSGLAALILEQHPQWTPARVKAALMATALPIDGEEVMAQGGGVADAARAIANDVAVTPPQLAFGLDGSSTPSFHATRRVQLRNEAATPRTMRWRANDLPDAIALTVTPPEVILAAGETRAVDVTIEVDHATLGSPPTLTFAFGGALLLEWEGGSLRLPWVFIRAGRATIPYSGTPPEVAWSGRGSMLDFASGLEVLVEPGTYDFALAAKNDGDYRVVVAENRRVEGDATLSFSPSQAVHEVRLEGVDENGLPFPADDGSTTVRSTYFRVLLGQHGSLELPDLRTLHISSFGENTALLAVETVVQAGARKVTVAQYPLRRGVSANTVLRVSPADYAPQSVSISFAPAATGRKVTITPRHLVRGGTPMTIPREVAVSSSNTVWTGMLWMTSEVHADCATGVRYAASTDQDPRRSLFLGTPFVRRGAAGFLSMRGFEESMLPSGTMEGEPLEFGVGPFFPMTRLRSTQTALLGDHDFGGSRNEILQTQARNMTYRVTNAAGDETAAGTIGAAIFQPPLSGDAPFRAEFRLGNSTLAARFGRDATIPALTSFMIVDGTGRHTNRLAAFGNGAVFFSASDAAAANVFFRRRGVVEWTELSAVKIGDEPLLGEIYRVDLHEALRAGDELDLAVEVLDGDGDTLRWELAPALTAGGTKRRSVE